jgi:hypothetical protein
MYAIVLPDFLTALGDKITSPAATSYLRHKILYTPGYEADVLALWLLRRRQPNLARDLTNLWLGEVTYRKQSPLQLVLSAGV